jgi:hypothetical protein
VRSWSNFLPLLPLMLTVYSTCAADNRSIQGTLIGADGTGFGGAEIRAERMDAKAAPVVTRTDAAGHYVFTGLPHGLYKLTAYVAAIPKSRVTVRTSPRGWVRANFDLRLNENGTEVDRMQRDLGLRSGTVGK